VRATWSALLAICWVEADVCCVDADTCSADADDSSATAATSPMSVCMRSASAAICWADAAMFVIRSLTSSTDVPIARNDSRRLLDSAHAVGRALSPALDDRRERSRLPLDLLDQPGDLGGRLLGALRELADLFGDDGEATAMVARTGGLDRGVEGQQVVCSASAVIVSTMPPIASDLAAKPPMAARTPSEDRATSSIASLAWAAASTPARATRRALSAMATVSSATRALSVAFAAASFTLD
jgi:hypothetical protein